MASAGTVVITMDADVAKVVEGIKKTNKSISDFQYKINKSKDKLASLAKAAGAFYLVKQGVEQATSSIHSMLDTASQFENYTNRMSAFTQGQVQVNAEVDRGVAFAKQYKTSISDTMDALLLMKNYGLDDSNESLKIFTNTAIGSGKSLSQYAEAVADALTGENERLKEFGLKASVQGQKIGYVWTDSLGKTRNIVIKNNKEIINSTLNAIMNEKYVGQIEKRASSMDGLIQGVSNKLTQFKIDVADAGLLNYFKALAVTVEATLGTAFADTGGVASGMVKVIMDGTESMIRSAGSVYDVWNGTSLVWEIIKNAALEAFLAINEALDGWPQAFSDRGVDIQNSFGETTTSIKQLWYEMINFLGKEWNEFYVDWAVGVNKISDYVGSDFRLEIPTFSPTVVEDFKKIEYAQNSVSDSTKYWQKQLQESNIALKEAYASVADEAGTKKANTFISELHKNYKEFIAGSPALEASIKKQKEAAIKALKALNAGYGQVDLSTKKATKSSKAASKAQTKALKDAQKEAKKLQDQLDVTAQSFADIFNQGFESILKGDFAGGLADIFGNAMQKATSNLSSAFSGGLSNLFTGAGSFTDAFKSLGSLDFLGSAVSLLGGLFSTTISESEIKAAAGRTEFDSKGTIDIVTTLDKYQQPQLTATKSMLEHLKSMDANLLNALSAANVGGLDLAGSTYTPQTSSVLGGVLFASSTELIGSGIKFYDQAVSSFTQGVEADGYEAIKKSSSFLGIFTSESISENLKDLPSGVKKQIGDAFNEGLQGALDGLEILGFDTASIEAKLNDYVVSLGKINFQDLNLEEQAKALNQALTSELNNALNTSLSAVANPQNYNALLSMAQAGEETVATIARVAVGYETAQTQLAMFGQSVTTFTQSQALIDAVGGLDAFTSKMDSFLQNFFTSEERDAMMEQQLQYALAVYDVALPASKEQYKALVLETQAKILAVQAQIDARKAEIRTMIESGKFQEQYVNNYAATQEYLGNVLGKSGQEVVAYGNNVRRSIEAMTTGQQEAITFDAELGTFSVDWNAFGDGILSSLEAEKSSLSGLYDTLLSSGDAFATVADNATSALNDLEQSLVAIANLKVVWGADDISAKKIILDATRRETGLTNLTYDNFLSEFESITANGLGIDKDTLQAYQDMSSALRALHDVEVQKVEKDIGFYNGIISNIRTLQDMSLTQEEIYARNLNEINNGTDNASVIKSVMEQANLLKDTSKTQDEYNFELRKLENTLADLKPEEDATTQDVVDSLKKLREELDDIKSEIAQGNRIALEQTA